MSGTQKFMAFVMLTIAAAIVAFTMTIAGCIMFETMVYTDKGYTRVQKYGTADTMWVKESK